MDSDLFKACDSARNWLREFLHQSGNDPMMMRAAFIHNKLNRAIIRQSMVEARAAACDAEMYLADMSHDDGAYGVVCDLRAALGWPVNQTA